MDFRAPSEAERKHLHSALFSNADHGATLLLRRDTSFLGVSEKKIDEMPATVISAVASIANHY